MPSFYSDMPRTNKEPQSRFYPTQGSDSGQSPSIPSAPLPLIAPHRPTPEPRPQTMPQEAPTPRSQMPPEAPRMPQEMPMQPLPPENRMFSPTPSMPDNRTAPRQRTGDMPYFEGRYPILLQRLYDAAGSLLDTYTNRDFLYDAYPDYLSLRLMRDRLLRENRDLTEEYLQAGCPIMWLELLTDTILSEQLCRRRREKINR